MSRKRVRRSAIVAHAAPLDDNDGDGDDGDDDDDNERTNDNYEINCP